MNVRKAFEVLVLPNCRESPATIRNNRHRINRWELHSGNPKVRDVSTETLRIYRVDCRACGLAPDTIESDLRTVMLCLRMAARLGVIQAAPWPGTPLTKRSAPRWVPSLDDVGKAYRHCDVARWPLHCPPGDFWRAFLVLGLWSGLRRSDLLFRLRRQDVTSEAIRCAAGKTGRMHIFPGSPVVSRHVEVLPEGERVFQVGKSLQQVRRELNRISEAARVEPAIQPQALRRASITSWEETATGAGRVIHGERAGVTDRHYLAGRTPPRILVDAADNFRWPDAMLLPEERDTAAKDERRMLRIWRRLAARDRRNVMAVAERIVG